MNVNHLIEHLQSLVNEDADIGKMYVRVIEETEFGDDGDAKDNHWIDSEEDIIVCPVSSVTGVAKDIIKAYGDCDHTGEIVIRGRK